MYFAGIRSSSESRRAPKPTTCRPESRIGHTARPWKKSQPDSRASPADTSSTSLNPRPRRCRINARPSRGAKPTQTAPLPRGRSLARPRIAELSTASGLLSCST